MKYRCVNICCNAGKGVGWGHLVRCLALALGFRSEGVPEVRFFFNSSQEKDFSKIEEKGFPVIRSPWCAAEGYVEFLEMYLKEGIADTLWVFDSYKLDAPFYKRVSQHTEEVFIIDDDALPRGKCRYFLNQNFGYEARPCGLLPSVMYLGGVDYFLLNPDILPYIQLRRERQKKKAINNILISFGGVDSKNQTLKVIHALNQLNVPLNITVVIGDAHPSPNSIKEAVLDSSVHSYHILEGQNSLFPHMVDTDTVFTAMGITSYEALAMGIFQFCIAVNDKQFSVSKNFPEQAGMRKLGRHNAITIETILKELGCYFEEKNSDIPKVFQFPVDGSLNVCHKICMA